jgi:hypothetical protein
MQFIIFLRNNWKSVPNWSTMIQIRDFSLIQAHVGAQSSSFWSVLSSPMSAILTGTLSRILKYSELCDWELLSSGAWQHVTGWFVGNVYKERRPFVFKDLAAQKQYILLGTKDSWRFSFERSGSVYPLSRTRTRDERDLQVKLFITYFLLFLFILLLPVLLITQPDTTNFTLYTFVWTTSLRITKIETDVCVHTANSK